MNKKKEAVGKYIADFLRTIGSAMGLFAGLGIVLDRPEALNNLLATVTIGFIGAILVIIGTIIVLLSTQQED